MLKNEVVTVRELGKAKEDSLKLQREIDAHAKSREQVCWKTVAVLLFKLWKSTTFFLNAVEL